jgi:hypothetical protein
MPTFVRNTAMEVPLAKKEARSCPPDNITRENNHHLPHQHIQSSAPSIEVAQSFQKSILAISNSRRPIKKRLRPPTQEETSPKILPQATAAATATSSIVTKRQPETLQEDQPLSGRTRYLSDRNKISAMTFFPEHCQELADQMGSDSDMAAMNAAADGLYSSPVSIVVTPPRLQRNKTSFFPLTCDHQALVEQRSARARITSCQDWAPLSIPRGSLPAFLSSLPGAGKKIVPSKIEFEECFEDDSQHEDEKYIGEEALHNMYRAVQEECAATAATLVPCPPPPLKKTESEAMCIMMKDLFEPSKRSARKESAVIQKSISRKSCAGSRMQTREESSTHIMEGAFSTMQQDMITTPKRSFRFQGNSFSSFASSASGSSRSSCVTPSPAKRMMTYALKRDIDVPIPPFGHRTSLSMGSLEGPPRKASAPTFPELGDSVNALTNVSRQYWLTEQEKIDKAKNIINIPPKLKPKLPPRHVGRALSGSKSRRMKDIGSSQGRFGSRRSLSTEQKSEIKRDPGSELCTRLARDHILNGNSFSTAYDELSADVMKTHTPPQGKNQHHRYEECDEIIPDFVATSSHPSSPAINADPSPHGSTGSRGSSISWIEHQQQMFNPHDLPYAAASDGIEPELGTANGSDFTSAHRNSQKTLRRISQF